MVVCPRCHRAKCAAVFEKRHLFKSLRLLSTLSLVRAREKRMAFSLSPYFSQSAYFPSRAEGTTWRQQLSHWAGARFFYDCVFWGVDNVDKPRRAVWAMLAG
jgi:hypothetical protein